MLIPYQCRIRRRIGIPVLSSLHHFPILFRILSALSILLITAFSFYHHWVNTPSLRASSPLHPGPNPYFWTGDISKHNDEVAARLDRCASLNLLRNTSLPLSPEQRPSSTEEEDLIAQGCGTNPTTVIILATLWAANAFSGTSTAGEAIYAQSLISTLNVLHYSYVFTSHGWYNPDMRNSVDWWHRYPWNVRTVIADPDQVEYCWRREDGKCLKSKENQEGIDAWRLLSLWYWDE